jgi:predicted RNA-binding Zn ribbon-like protein
MSTRLKASGKRPATELYFEPQQPEDLFAPLAHSAASLFANADRARVRKCHHCVLHFHDTSEKGTRRWCSMQLCHAVCVPALSPPLDRGTARH